jgi:hypothetical protein
VWISATGRWWALRRDPLTAAHVAAGALPLLNADTGTGLAAQIRLQDHRPDRPPATDQSCGLPRRQPRGIHTEDP